MALQPVTGAPSSLKAPFTMAEILLGQGPSNASSPGRDAVYVGPKTSAGTWLPYVLYVVDNEKQAELGAGPGSFPHRSIRKHLKISPGKRLYAMVYPASTGGGVATATATVTVAMTTGSNPTGIGIASMFVCGEVIQYVFGTSDTVSTIAAGLAASANGRTHLPCTFGATLGAITATAKTPGACSGDTNHKPVRIRVDYTAGMNVTVTTSGNLGSTVPGADGATTELASLTQALAVLENEQVYYRGFTVWNEGSTAAVETHMRNQNAPSPGHLCRAFHAFTGTISATSTIAIARNTEYHHLAWQKGSDHDAAELTAILLALTQLGESKHSAFPGFDNFTHSEILPAPDPADWPKDLDVEDAVKDGICVFKSNRFGANLAMHVTTRSKDATGLIDDFRATETHRISAMHDFVATILLNFYLTFQAVGFWISEDPLLPNGDIDQKALAELGAKVLTPSRFKPWFKARIRDFVLASKFQGQAKWFESVAVNVDPNNTSRLECGASGRTIDILHQATFLLAETSPG